MGNNVVLDRLDRFCCPVSQFIERDVSDCSECTCALTPPTGNNTTGETILTLCFQDTALLYLILGLFWFLSGLKVCRRSKRKAVVPVNWLNITKTVICGLLILPPVVDLLYTIVMVTQQKVAYFLFLSPVMLALSMGLAGFITYYERVRGVHSSALMSVLWMAMVGYGTLKLFTLALQASELGNIPDEFRFGTFIVELVLFLIQLVLSFVSEKKSAHRQYSLFTEEGREPCPEESASFYSRLTWWWLNKIVWIGWRRSLTYDDLYDLNDEDKSEVVSGRFIKEWEKELKKANISFYQQQHGEEGADDPEVRVRRPRCCSGKGHNPSLVLAMAKTFFSTFMMAGLFKFLQDLLQFATPVILKLIILYTHDFTQPVWKGYFYAILMFSVAVGQSVLLHQYFHRGFVVGMRVRTAILSTVYKKALRLSNRARRSRTVGEIVNLMSVDAQRIMDFMPYAHSLWSSVFQIIGSLLLLYQTVGWSVVAGVSVMVLLIPINMAMASLSKKYQVKQMAKKDKRTKLVNEVLNGIKVIKLYAWEKPFKRLISELRIEELRQFKYAAYIGSGMVFFWTCSPFMVALATFATYAIATKDSTNPDDLLTADRAFVALSLFNILRFPLLMLPNLITMLVQVNVSVKRLREFLEGEELDPDNTDWREEPAEESDSVTVSDGTFTWDTPERPNLSNINLHIKPGELVAVVGHVGAGKSSLISALLGEMDKMNGHVTLRGSVAYVPQVAWIQNAKLKDNVLFGKILNEPFYNKTLQECALESDLEILPGGDMTEIGEKGINLSGGQKQRVSLARAVYQEADIYLLDDPLSAVDSHVGKHIFDKVIGPDGMLRGKVRILVTHGLGFLPQCDRIVVMDDGKVTESGAYAELMDNNGAFAEFIRHYSTMEENEEGDPSAPGLEGVLPGEDGHGKLDDVAADSPAVIRRKLKKTSESSEEENKFEGKRRASEIMTEETVETGTVKPSVILAYCKACSYPVSIIVIILYLFQNAASVGNNFWLAEWSNENSVNPNNTQLPLYLGVYTVLGFFQAFLVLAAAFAMTFAGIRASTYLHDAMLNNIIRSPMSFFDTTPLGRILNRFSKDIYTIDEVIPRSLRAFLMTFITCIGTLLVIVVASPWFLIVGVPVLVVYVAIQRFYVGTSRQLKRLESVTRSPIYSHCQESVTGVSTIRAYRLQERFTQQIEDKVDYNQMSYYPSICSNRWLAIRLEFLGNIIILFSVLFAVLQRNYHEVFGRIDPGLAGLSITYALQVTQSLNWLVRMTSELETNVVSVERTKEYSETAREAPPIVDGHRPPRVWPVEGKVQFERYSTRYREGLDLVLKQISCDIRGGEKVGIVGRTGAGKSSLTVALFRIIEAASGAILIDGEDIATYGLDDLRSRITIIPQDPVLFSGTLRINLDPFNTHSDDEVWQALQTAHLKTFVSDLPEGLEYAVSEGGENLSVGQRQLVCLARALLRKTKILVLDEATAAVDMETDDLIQKTIRTEFADSTVLTIAHRLNTILDYDRVMVLSAGEIVEFDSPNKLIEDGGVFHSLAKDAGLI